MQDIKNKPAGTPPPKVALYAFFMALGTLLSRFLGLFRESLFAALFPRWITDAWYVAFRLPNVFRRLFGEGSLAVSFIPVLVEVQKKEPHQAPEFAQGFFLFFSIFLLIITALGALYMEPLLGLLMDSQYQAQTEKWDLTLKMARIMFLYIYLVCAYAFLMAVLNSLGRFGLPALAPAFFNLIMILSTLWPQTLTSWSGQALAWGVIIGGMIQVAFLVPSLWRLGYGFKWKWVGWSPKMGQVITAMVPGVLGMGLMQLLTLVNLFFSSQLPEGSISYITLADRLLELPLSLISVSLGAALLPTLSRLWVENKATEMLQLSRRNLSLNLYLSLPAAIGLMSLALPIVHLLFQRGQFSAQEAGITAQVLRVSAWLVIFSSLVRVFVPNYYAIKNTWYPALVSGVCLMVHVLMASWLIPVWGLFGLNLSTVISSLFNLVLLTTGFAFFVSTPFPWKELIVQVRKFIWPLFFMGLFLFSSNYIYSSSFSTLQVAIMLIIYIPIALLIYFWMSYVIRVPEFMQVYPQLKKRLKFLPAING